MHVANAAEPSVSSLAVDEIHANLLRLRSIKGEVDAEIGRWLLAARHERVHARFGFGSVFEYAERMFGYEPRHTREKLRVAGALRALPQLRGLLESGERSWSVIREITRVATPEVEAAWIESTSAKTVREVEAMVTGRHPGESPAAPKDPLITPRRVAAELMPHDYALLMEACEQIRKDIGPGATFAQALCAMAETVLGGRPANRPAYQTALGVCALCDRTFQRAGGEMVEVSPAVAESARCDGEVIGFTQLEEGNAEPELAAHAGHATPRGPTTHVGRSTAELEDAIVEQFHQLAKDGGPRALIRVGARVFGAKRKSMTPRTREMIRARDKNRCVFPGCRNFRFIEIHHDIKQAHGGPHSVQNGVSACTAHHRALHEGHVALEVSPDGTIRVRHAGGTSYGALGQIDTRT